MARGGPTTNKPSTEINRIVWEALYPRDIALVPIGLSVVAVVLNISPIAWTHVRPSRTQPT